MRCTDPIAEAFVERKVARQLAAHTNADLSQSMVPGITMRPLHQRSPDAAALMLGVYRNPTHKQGVRVRLKAQASHHVAI